MEIISSIAKFPIYNFPAFPDPFLTFISFFINSETGGEDTSIKNSL